MDNKFWIIDNGSESYLSHHGIKGQKWGKRNGPPYPLGSDISTGKALKKQYKSKKVEKDKEEDFDPFEAMNKIDNALPKSEQDLLGVGNDQSTDDIKFFFNKDKTAYLITADYHGKYKDEHPVDGKVIGIAALPEARGKGYTDKLISDAKKEFPNDRLVAEIDQNNEASRKLFERNGFNRIKSDNGIDYYIYDSKVDINSIAEDRIYQYMEFIPFDFSKGQPFSKDPDDFALKKGDYFYRLSKDPNESFKDKMYVSQNPGDYAHENVMNAKKGNITTKYTYTITDDILVAGKGAIINALKDIDGSGPIINALMSKDYNIDLDNELDFIMDISNDVGTYKDVAKKLIKSLNDRGFDAILDPLDSNMGRAFDPSAMIFLNDKKLKVIDKNYLY